jgi:hypothetical protein
MQPASAVRDRDGADVSQRRLLEDQLRQSQKMEPDQELAGGVARLRNLLTAIIGYADLLAGELRTASRR